MSLFSVQWALPPEKITPNYLYDKNGYRYTIPPDWMRCLEATKEYVGAAESSHNSNLQCDLCGKHCNTKTTLVKHRKKHDADLICNTCGFYPETYESLRRHYYQEHKKKKAKKKSKTIKGRYRSK